MGKLGWLIVSLFAVAVVVDSFREDVLSYEQREYEVVKINPPTQFSVDLRDVETDVVTHVYVSKTCYNYKRLKVGARVWLLEATYASRKAVVEDHVLQRTICYRGE